MKELETIRQEIDTIDKQMITLFEKRMHLVEDVIAYKKENNLPIFQSDREQEVIKKNVSLLKDEKLKVYARAFLICEMELSKNYQKELLEKEG